MSWGQKNAHFYCRVKSQRQHDEIILSDKPNGLRITAACDLGGLEIILSYNHRTGNSEYTIQLIPWRKSEERDSTLLAMGVLNHDMLHKNETVVRLDDRLIEMYRTAKAHRVMTEDL